LINKTFKQLNDERAGWRAHLKRRSRVFKENQKRLKTASSQAGGPAPKESGFKPPSFPDSSCNNLFDREVE